MPAAIGHMTASFARAETKTFNIPNTVRTTGGRGKGLQLDIGDIKSYICGAPILEANKRKKSSKDQSHQRSACRNTSAEKNENSNLDAQIPPKQDRSVQKSWTHDMHGTSLLVEIGTV